MFDLSNDSGVVQFKKRLAETRKSRGLTQENLAISLNYDRSRITGWERINSTGLMSLSNFVSVCKLLDVDPNFLLGASDLENVKEQTISEEIGLSSSNVRLLKNDKFLCKFINHLLSSTKTNDFMHHMKQICHYEYLSEALDTTFTPNALLLINKSFAKFQQETFPLDMNIETFSKYIRSAFAWNPQKVEVNDFINSMISENEYQNIIFEYPDFQNKKDSDKYEILIENISKTSFNYMMSKPFIDLAEYEVTKMLNFIVKDFIHHDTENFKGRNK